MIKAPVLLELSGPMFMSYPALNHIEVKVEQRAVEPIWTSVTGPSASLTRRTAGFDEAHLGWSPGLLATDPECPPRELEGVWKALSDSTR